VELRTDRQTDIGNCKVRNWKERLITELTGRRALRWRRFALDCSATSTGEEEEEGVGEKKEVEKDEEKEEDKEEGGEEGEDDAKKQTKTKKKKEKRKRKK